LGGTTREHLLGMTNRQYTDETTAKKLDEVFRGIYKTGQPVKGCEFEFSRSNGTKGFIEFWASPIRNAQGKPIGFRGISRDITERKTMEEALRRGEERYRTMIETMQDGYWETDLPGNFTYVNNSECKIAGTPREQLLGKNNRQYTDAATAKRLYEIFKGIYTTGEPVKSCEFEFIKRDGTRAFAEFSASLRRDEEGKPIGFQGVTRDATERKKMEEALKLRLKQLGALSRASQVVTATLAIDDVLEEIVSLANKAVGSDYTGVVLVDESGNLVRSADNVPGIPSIERRIREKGFTHWIIHSHKALIIDEIGEDGAVISPADLDEGMPRFADTKLVEAGVKSLAGLPLLAKGRLLGVLYLHGVRPNVFKGQLGLLTAFANQAAIAIENARLFEEAQNELAERKRAEEHLQRYAAELERSNEEVKNFAYIVSHDLRVPLVNLKGYTSELQSALGVVGTHFDTALPHLNEEARSDVAMALHEDVPEALEFITNSVSRMDGFINAVLILSRLGRRELKPEPIDMNAVVQTVLEPLSYQIQEREIAVTVDSLPEVVADRTSMEQIMGNILGNAVKYLDPDRPAEIEINAERNHQETIFRIRDTGRGIAQEDMHKVFAPFRRAGKQDTPGEGMGLAYVQTLVRRHGGRIWCESELGKGTTFTFTIANPSKKGAYDA
jgi:PAS domain S-box-containing protein